MNILILDDNHEICLILQYYLQQYALYSDVIFL